MIKIKDFDVILPALDGRGEDEAITIQIPMEWDEEIGEWLMTEEGMNRVERIKREHRNTY